MRAAARPVITGFQQSVEAAFSDQQEPLPPHGKADDIDSWKRELGPTTEGGYEPYRPDMLPGRTPPAPQNPARTDSASGAVNELRKAGFQMQAQSGPPADTRPSLRESLLKKPLGSLYRKD